MKDHVPQSACPHSHLVCTLHRVWGTALTWCAVRYSRLATLQGGTLCARLGRAALYECLRFGLTACKGLCAQGKDIKG